jgi:hypothetical protein
MLSMVDAASRQAAKLSPTLTYIDPENVWYETCISGPALTGTYRTAWWNPADGNGQGPGEEQSRMIKRWFVILAGVSLSVSATGCGNPPGYYPVQGKVFYKGNPAAGAVVYFHQEGSNAISPQAVPFGIVEGDGSYSLSCDGVGNGCPPGKYAVLVEWRDGAGDGIVPVKTVGKTKLVKRSRVRSGPDRLDGRYFNSSKPLLHVEVLPQSNSLDPFELGG